MINIVLVLRVAYNDIQSHDNVSSILHTATGKRRIKGAWHVTGRNDLVYVSVAEVMSWYKIMRLSPVAQFNLPY